MSDVDLVGWLAKAEASQARHAAAVAQEASLRAQVSAAAEWERSGRRALHLATALHAGTAAELLESSSRLQHATARLAQLALIQPIERSASPFAYTSAPSKKFTPAS